MATLVYVPEHLVHHEALVATWGARGAMGEPGTIAELTLAWAASPVQVKHLYDGNGELRSLGITGHDGSAVLLPRRVTVEPEPGGGPPKITFE